MQEASNGQSQSHLETQELRKEIDELRSLLKSQQTSGDSGNLVQQMLDVIKVKSPGHKHQAHGLTVDQMEELRLKQAVGEKLEQMPASEDPKYLINKHEAHLVHVYLENVEFNPKTGKKISNPGRVQKFAAADFDRMQRVVTDKTDKSRPQNAFGAFDVVTILHDPRPKSAITKIDRKPVMEMTLDQMREEYRIHVGEEPEDDISVAGLMFEIDQAKIRK